MTSIRALVPLDGSELAEQALRFLSALSVPAELTVRLLLVWDEEEETEPKRRLQQARLLASYLGLRAKSLKAEGMSVDTAVMAGQPAAMIIAEAARWQADFIVISTHGRSGLNRWRLGGVADKVIRGASINTLVIGPHAEPHAKTAIRAILVPLDGSRLAEQALPVAQELAARLGSQIHLVRIVPPQIKAEDVRAFRYSPEFFQNLLDSAQSYLEEVKERLGAVETSVMTGPPVERLLAYASEKSIDLVAMTSHGRGGLLRAALGSVTDRLLGGPVPILVVHPNAASGFFASAAI